MITYGSSREEASNMPILELLKQSRIFEITKESNGIKIKELCDQNFSIQELDKADLRRLAYEIIELSSHI